MSSESSFFAQAQSPVVSIYGIGSQGKPAYNPTP